MRLNEDNKMSTLPISVAKPTFTKGKTDRAKVVDVYANTEQANNLAQNEISSVLTGVGSELFKNVEKILGGDKFVKGLSETTKAFLNGDPSSGDKVRSLLKEYKGGGLSGMLETNTVKELKKFGDGVVKGVEGNVKEIAFGSVKGFVDKLVPGVLDSVGLTNFKEAKKFYDSMVKEIEDTHAGITRLFGGDDDKEREVAKLNTLVLDTSIEVINSILGPSTPITIRSTNLEIDNAILASSSNSLIEEDNETINNKIFDAMENDEVRELYISTTVSAAAGFGSINFIIKAASLSSDSFVKANLYSTLEDFLKKVTVPKTSTDAERIAFESKLLRVISIFTGKPDTGLTIDCFQNLPKNVYDILVFSETYATLVGLANTIKPTTPGQVYENSYPELIIT